MVVPNIFLNKNLIMKLHIMKKNSISFTNELSLMDVYKNNIHKEVKEFDTLKTLFKEIKIIRPLSISKSKQIDFSPDASLLQFKVGI